MSSTFRSLAGINYRLWFAGALVSNDSGPMHIGAALGTPTLGLFGPETPVMYAPIGRRTSALWRPPVCSPCINVHDNKVANCVRGHPECLTNLSVEEVHEELQVTLPAEAESVAVPTPTVVATLPEES